VLLLDALQRAVVHLVELVVLVHARAVHRGEFALESRQERIYVGDGEHVLIHGHKDQIECLHTLASLHA
jgi:hypothetical protein